MDHFTGAVHEHGNSHAHDHTHEHGPAEYFKEQLLTVFICGAFGVVGVLMYRFGMLKHILAADFHLPVLIGGGALLLLTAVRGIALWKEAGNQHALHQHDHHGHEHHDHAPGEACNHDLTHSHDHSHDDHDHGNVYWRIVVLGFPILLFCLGIPNSTFSSDWIEKRLGNSTALGDIKEVAQKDGAEPLYDFSSLTMATHSRERMEALEGTPAKIKGQLRFFPNREKEFELFYMKMTCCATDIVPLQARIVVARPSVLDAVRQQNIKQQDWVEVSGTIQFQEIPGQQKYVTVIMVRDVGGVVKTAPVE